jgi:hypothetical protein
MLHFKNIVSSFLFLGFSCLAFSQKVKYPRGLQISFSLPKSNLTDTNKFAIKVVFRNSQYDTLSIYKKLIDGASYDIYANIRIELQKLKGNGYKDISAKRYDYFYSSPAFEFEYVDLPPGESIEREYDMFTFQTSYEKGKYRVRIFLRKIPLNRSGQHTMEYYSSKWLYFSVAGDLNRKN